MKYMEKVIFSIHYVLQCTLLLLSRNLTFFGRRKGRQEEEREEKSKGGNGKKKENVYMSWFAHASISKYHRLGDLTI